MNTWTMASSLLILLGAVFLLLGAVGLVRMPDVYNRIQASTKATTLGTLAVLLGLGVLHPDWSLKLLLIGVFVLFTSPVSSSTLARAALIAGIPPVHRTSAPKE